MKFLSYLKIKISKEQRNLAMDVILKNHLSYKKSEILPDLNLEIIISPSQRKIFEEVFSKNSINAEFGDKKGILSYLAKYKHRYGIILGMLFLILMVNLSSNFIWRIEIEGNDTISKEQILTELEASGCSLGTFIPSIDYDLLHNKFLLNSNDISWISINIKGNVARIVVRERMKEEYDDKSTYTNVVSKYDAQIASISIHNGKKVVSAGDVVKKGELLISGVINSQSQGTRYVHADGEVMAYVNKPILIKIPFNSTQKVYTGGLYKQKSAKIFSNSINFLLNYRNNDILCDKIEEKNRIELLGKELPIELTTIYYREYELKNVTYTHSQAIDLAFVKLREELDLKTQGAELISKEVKTHFDKEAFYIECNLYCLENIASLVEFEVK